MTISPLDNKDLYLGLLDLVDNSEDKAFFFCDTTLDGITYRIFNYHLVNYTTFTTNLYAPYARGIMFKVTPEGEYIDLVCLPMNKFFNYAEGSVNHDSENTKVLAIHEKLDGSLISSYIHKGQLKLKSKGSLSSDQALAAMEFLDKTENIELKCVVLILTLNGFTVNMEWTSPNNRIVIGYDKDALRILNTRSLRSHLLDLYFDKKQSYYAKNRQDILDKLETISLTKLVEELYLEEQGEGYILTLKNPQGSYQVKIKNFKYCDLHHLKDSINSTKALFNLVIKGQTDDLVEAFTNDPIALNIIKEMEDLVIPKFNNTIKLTQDFYTSNKELDKKSYAILAKETLSNNTLGNLMSIAMNLYIGRETDYEEFANKNIDKFLGVENV